MTSTKALSVSAAACCLLLTAPAYAQTAYPYKNCNINGDSTGVQLALAKRNKYSRVLDMCTATVRGAMDSAWIMNNTQKADISIFLAGTNDNKKWNNPVLVQQLRDKRWTVSNLEAMRKKSECKICVWVQPATREPGQAVAEVAAKYSDRLVKFKPGSDKIHMGNPVATAKNVINITPELLNMPRAGIKCLRQATPRHTLFCP